MEFRRVLFRSRQAEYFEDYCRKYSDMPMLVKLVEKDGAWVPENLLRAADFLGSLGEANNPDWKTVAIDEATDEVVVPSGSAGLRWGEEGKWNLQEKDGCSNRSEEHTSEFQSLMRISYAVFCLKKHKLRIT